MKCPACHARNPEGQKFCGACGQKLEVNCPQCAASNPPDYKFCGQCGAALSAAGALTLARSGLITDVNTPALEMLGYQAGDMQGKPFSLFVDRPDMVVFFSHWNDLLNTAQSQSFEISLKHKSRNRIFVMLEGTFEKGASRAADTIRLRLFENSHNRLEAARLQSQQDLLGLIFTVTNNICNVSSRHLAVTIEDALKKICLYAGADIGFIYSINRQHNRLDSLYQWRREAACPAEACERLKTESIPLARVKNTILKLRQEKMVVIDEAAELTDTELAELARWFNLELSAIIYYLIYSGKNPIGIIGVARMQSEEAWSQDCASLVRFLGDFMADRLPVSPGTHRTTAPTESVRPVAERGETRAVADMAVTPGGKAPGPRPDEANPSEPAGPRRSSPDVRERSILPDMTRPMRFDKHDPARTLTEQKFFLRDDNLVLITCPNCGLQESVSLGRFEKLGSTMQVTCSCHEQFAAVLEKRRFFRKKVKLDGYFSLGDKRHPEMGDGNIWGQMVVRDLSKAGLRFSSEKANLIRIDDLVMVRFNLDNTNKALIHKAARVITLSDDAVGCRFEGDDSYDITLGFYFM